jgi:hypothetical protein
MPRPKPNKLHDELDALRDGRPVELTAALAPRAEAADALRAELAAYQLDPQVADRHLERVLHGSATVVRLPVRGQPNGWDLRRRAAAVVLAAALVLAPATMASAAALPGQPMYPFKRAIEELRVASVQWSASREAVERTRIVDARVDEVDMLVELRMYSQLLPAIAAMQQAVVKAKEALDDARKEGELSGKAEVQLDKVMGLGQQVLDKVAAVARTASVPLNDSTRNAIQAAVKDTQDVLVTPPRDTGQATPTPSPSPTTGSQAGPAGPGSGGSTPSSQPQTQPSNPTPEQSTTTQTTTPTTTAPPTTTTAPEPSTPESTVTPGSADGGGDTGGDQAGADGRTTEDATSAGDVPTP